MNKKDFKEAVDQYLNRGNFAPNSDVLDRHLKVVLSDPEIIFAKSIAKGITQRKSYCRATGKKDNRSAEVNGYRWNKRPGIIERVQEERKIIMDRYDLESEAQLKAHIKRLNDISSLARDRASLNLKNQEDDYRLKQALKNGNASYDVDLPDSGLPPMNTSTGRTYRGHIDRAERSVKTRNHPQSWFWNSPS